MSSEARLAATRRWRARNRDKLAAQRAVKRAFVNGYKREIGCADCGTKEGQLDLDHRSGETKLFSVGLIDRSWRALLAEIAKCDVRCRPCHQRRHGLERGGINAAA